MNATIAVLVGMLALGFAGAAGSAPQQLMQLGYEQSGIIQSIDRNKGTIRIDGQDFLLPDYLSGQNHRASGADAGVEYRAGDQVGYTISADTKRSGLARLSVLWLLTS